MVTGEVWLEVGGLSQGIVREIEEKHSMFCFTFSPQTVAQWQGTSKRAVPGTPLAGGVGITTAL